MQELRFRIIVLLVCAGVTAVTRSSAGAGADVILRAADATVVQGTWSVVTDPSAAGGARLSNPDAGQPKPPSALAAPSSYFELTFTADAGVAYHLWLRGRAEADRYENDSVYVQFSDSVTPDGGPLWRIGTASGTSVVLEDCPGCGVSGWGWQDNHYGGIASPIYFAAPGAHTIRVQVREDGLSIDQIVLSPATYLTGPPGAPRDDTTILAEGGTPQPPAGVTLIRGPYLQQVTDRSAVIVWASREAGAAAATVGGRMFPATSTFYGSVSTGTADYFQHEAVITGLQPDTAYTYQLLAGDTAATSGNDQLRTAPALGTGRVRFIAFGDSGTGSPEQLALASRMNADPFDLALHAGDLVYGDASGTGDATHAAYQAWFFDVYRSWLRRRPVFPSMGNHDGRESNEWGRAYLDLFVLPAEAGSGPFADHAERYYSFDYGPVHFVALDTELTLQDPSRRAAQIAWLEADLAAASGQPWKVAFFHRSPYSSGSAHGSELSVREAFGPLFERYGVQLSVSAHEHGYERSAPWREGPGQAVTYVVTGGGGAPLHSSGRDTWTAASASEHHYVRVTIDGCVATIEAVRAEGTLVDSHQLDRCAQASDAASPTVAFAALAQGMTVSGATSVDAIASDDVRIEKVDLWVDGRLHGIDPAAPYSFSWNAGAAPPGPHTLELRTYDIAGNRAAAAITVNVAEGGGTIGLPAGWTASDIGNVAIAGSSSHAGGVFTIDAAGADIWGTSDAFRYTFQPLAGDGEIVARVTSMQGAEPWMKAGVMIRASLEPSATHAFTLVSLSRGLALQSRATPGGATAHQAGPAMPAPYWVRLQRSGHLFVSSVSPDGSTWAEVGSEWIPMPADVSIGLAVTSHASSALASATFDHVSIAAAQALPPPWQALDIGAVGAEGLAGASGGAFTVQGSGADIWGTQDAFRFVYAPVTGDVTITARVESLEAVHEWAKAGVMIRAALTPKSRHAMMIVSGARGLAFQRRVADAATSTHTAGISAAAPAWVRLRRSGAEISAWASMDGSAWTLVGSDTIQMPQTVYVGLPVTSHAAGVLTTASFSNVSVIGP